METKRALCFSFSLSLSLSLLISYNTLFAQQPEDLLNPKPISPSKSKDEYLKKLALENGKKFIALETKNNEIVALYQKIPQTSISPELVSLIKQISAKITDQQKAYETIIHTEDEHWKIPSMYQISWLKLSYSQALRQIAFDENSFSLELQKMYEKFLKDRVDPIEKSGVTYLIHTYEKSLSLEINNQWTDKVIDLLQVYQINPSDIKKKWEAKQPKQTQTPNLNSILPKDIHPQSIVWKRIPGGIFQMGSTSAGFDAVPVHTVRIKEFCLSRSEITVSQYRQCVQAGTCSEPKKGKSCHYWEKAKEQHPVNCVSWFQARTFSRWVGGDLPSESEWEYAATSGGKSQFYAWGTDEANCQKAWMYDEGGFGCGTNRAGPVCQKIKGMSEHGVCDLMGNVGEWVLDEYRENYQLKPRDGQAYCSQKNCEGGTQRRVDKGGDFYCGGGDLKAQLRNRSYPSTQQENLGFRVRKNCLLVE